MHTCHFDNVLPSFALINSLRAPAIGLIQQRRNLISIDLPRPIADFFAADKGKPDALSRYFTDNAVVRDEGHTYRGVDEIKRWKAETATKYIYTIDTTAVGQSGGKTVVTGHLVGNFPGSPIDLRYFFELEGDKIALLEIIP